MPIGPLAGFGLSTGLQALLGGAQAAAGKSGKWKQLQSLTPEQQALSNWAGQYGQQQISNPYAGFDPIAKAATSRFQQTELPTLAERFAGTGNAMSSPVYNSQMYSANKDFQEGLASLMAQYGLQQQGLGQSLLGMGLRPQFENVFYPARNTFLSGLLGGAAGGMGQLANLDLNTYIDSFKDKNKTNPAILTSWIESLISSMRGR